jgi:RND family efflux transporter MFP subunit
MSLQEKNQRLAGRWLATIRKEGKNRMKNALKIGGVVILVLALVGAGTILLRQNSGSATAEEAVPTAVVSVGSIEELVSTTGNVVADRQASLAFATSGEIAKVLVREGQEVEPGQVLARLDTSSLEWQIARSEASLASAQARLEQVQQPASDEDLASAQAALDSARASLEKTQEGSSEEDLASAQAALDSAQANYDKVKAGPTEEELAAAQAQVDNARASVQQAQAAYDRVKDKPDVAMRQESLNLQSATISLEQAQANYDSVANHPTASELASAEAQVAQAEASLAALLDRPNESEIASAEAQVVQAEASLNTLLNRPNAEDVTVQQAAVEEAATALAQAEAQLEDAVVSAPFGGVVAAVNVNEGEWASPGAPAFVLVATEPLILDVSVDEVDVAEIAEGQKAHLSFDALKGEEIPGTVTYIAPASTDVGGAVAYGVEISFGPETEAGQALPVRLGMTADVDIVVASAEGVLLVPNRAIEADREAGRYYVTRQSALDTTERLEVQIGVRDESHTQILEGLEEGDVLVLPQVPEQEQEGQGFGMGGGGGMGGMLSGQGGR